MILFKNVNLISMADESVEYAVDVLIKDDLIIEIGKGINKCEAEVVSCSGNYLMPALFDAHVHYNSSEMGKLFIANGVTGVRHMSGGESVKAHILKIEKGEIVGPKVYSTGAIYDGISAENKKESYRYIQSYGDAERAVMDTIREGFRWVKTYPSISEEHLRHLMMVASREGIGVCGHMSYRVDSKVLLEWGYQCCEHSSSLPGVNRDIRYLAEHGLWLCPTQVVCETLPDYVWGGKTFEDLEHYKCVPQKVKQFWESKNQEIIKEYRARQLRPDIQTVIDKGKVFMLFSDNVIAGTDAMYPGIIAGYSLHDELEKMVDLYGQTAYQALKMATVNPARFLGRAHCSGKVLVGYDADLLLLRDNPLETIGNTRTIEAVMKSGKLYDRMALNQMIEESMTEPSYFIDAIL